jgi:hypothetical protein
LCIQQVKLDKNIKMIDSPGIVMASSVDPVERVLRNCTRLESSGVDASLVVEHILRRCTRNQMMLQYSIPSNQAVLTSVALMHLSPMLIFKREADALIALAMSIPLRVLERG